MVRVTVYSEFIDLMVCELENTSSTVLAGKIKADTVLVDCCGLVIKCHNNFVRCKNNL